MKNVKKITVAIIILITIFTNCKEKQDIKIYEFTEEEISLLPYKKGDTLLFKETYYDGFDNGPTKFVISDFKKKIIDENNGNIVEKYQEIEIKLEQYNEAQPDVPQYSILYAYIKIIKQKESYKFIFSKPSVSDSTTAIYKIEDRGEFFPAIEFDGTQYTNVQQFENTFYSAYYDDEKYLLYVYLAPQKGIIRMYIDSNTFDLIN